MLGKRILPHMQAPLVIGLGHILFFGWLIKSRPAQKVCHWLMAHFHSFVGRSNAGQLKAARLDTFHNFWDSIHDFTPKPDSWR